MQNHISSRITLLGATFFLRLFCQCPGAFYYRMISATLPELRFAKLPRDLFCVALKRREIPLPIPGD